MKNTRIKVLAALVFAGLTSGLFADETPIPNLSSYKLNNGLELFVAENHAVPLVYIEIAVRAGGIAQTDETAGLFHLYEHLMFDGNKKYPTPQNIQNEFTNLGVASYNGSTTVDYVNYFFTIPADKLEEGLDFWNYAIRTPIINKTVLEKEKKVVLQEIKGQMNDVAHKSTEILGKTFFKESPWINNPGGTEESVKNATVKQLKNIQKQYYIPNNSALFVGGDVNTKQVYDLVNKIYGSWKPGKNPWENKRTQLNKAPLDSVQKFVIGYDQLSDQIAITDVYFRGPDAEFDRKDTYLADTLLFAASDPKSYFKTSLANISSLGIMDSEYCSIGYQTKRRSGLITVEAVMYAPNQFMPLRGQIFAEAIADALKGTLPVDSSLTDRSMQLLHKLMYNENLYEQETFVSLLSTVRFWWACADSDYYYNYNNNIKSTTAEDVNDFISRYIENQNPLIMILVNPEVLKECKAEFEAAGYEVIE